MKTTLPRALGATLLTVLGAEAVVAQAVLRVPQDVATLQQAIDQVTNGGTVELAAGSYPAPANGFRVRRSHDKSLTVRAAPGSEVVLDGGQQTIILRIEGDGAGLGRRVAIEGLTFRHGLSTDLRFGGAVTVDAADVDFASCRFEDNVLDLASGGGGAVHIKNGSAVRFVNSQLSGNTSRNSGGGIHAVDSKVDVVWSELIGNRVDVEGHAANAIGGGIYALDSELEVRYSRIADNRAIGGGGGIFVFGRYPETTGDGLASRGRSGVPASVVRILNSVLSGNVVDPGTDSNLPFQPAGGGFHAENDVEAVVEGSTFAGNLAYWGGALSAYRASLTVNASVVTGGLSSIPFGILGSNAAGGLISITSGDNNELSTDFGAIDRPNAELTMTDSLVQASTNGAGSLRAAASGSSAYDQGGCLYVSGDANRLDGVSVPQQGVAEDHRARVVLERVVFANCEVETNAQGTGLGGAMMLRLVDFTMVSSLILDSAARGAGASGGAVFGFGDSILRFSGTTFARNRADDFGGALAVSGSRLEVENSSFIGNQADAAVRGAAIFSSPSNDGLDVEGTVRGSSFTGNLGVEILEVDNVDGPFNLLTYDDNDIFPATPGAGVFQNTAFGPALQSVAELNALSVPRDGAAATKKSAEPNSELAQEPRLGTLIAAPPILPTKAPPGADPPSAFLGLAWSGGEASVNGDALAAGAGVETVTTAGRYVLRVEGEQQATSRVEEVGCSGGGLLCLNRERFLVQVDWRNFTGGVGSGTVVSGGSDDSGLFWFIEEENWEMLVKVLDGCPFTDHFWVFAGATTNVEYTLRVTDTLGGATRAYSNPLAAPAVAITDTGALASCDAAGSQPAPLIHDPRPRRSPPAVAGRRACADEDTALCLNQSRFLVEVEWRNFEEARGSGHMVQLRSDDSGLFWFFEEDNWEMLVKVIDGCGINDRVWVFAAATTNVEYTLRVTDTVTGLMQEYFNPLGTAALATTDTVAFAACP